MKWYENGIMFEGTPAEFRALHPEIAGSAPVSPVSVFPEPMTAPEQTLPETKGKRGGHPHLHIMAELSGGGERHFKSASSAYKWYSAASPVRKYRNYFAFYKALKEGAIRFADATLKIA